MYDIRYVECSLSSQLTRRNLFYVVNVVGIVLFLIVSFVVGPLVHELTQIWLVVLYNCHYVFKPSFDWHVGVYASVMPLCTLTRMQEVVFYSVGILLNLGVALFFALLSWIFLRWGKFYSSNLCLYLTVGFSLNPILYFFAESGNLINLLKVLGMGEYYYALPLVGAVLFAVEVVYSYVVVMCYKREYDNIVNRILRVREFISSMNSAGENSEGEDSEEE